MAETTEIAWCDSTFNPWIGCTKVSPGCKNCYAETLMDTRYGRVQWGSHGTRSKTSPANWKKPIGWNKQEWWECQSCGYRGSIYTFDDYCPECRNSNCRPTRQRVFCASLSDVFEDRPELVEWRRELLELIIKTPNLDWLLLTKRPENVNRMIEEATGFSESHMWFHAASNVWIGTSVENQETYERRLPDLLEIPAKIRFLSMEPLLEPVNLDGHLPYEYYVPQSELTNCFDDGSRMANEDGIHWVIVGGESGSNARPMNPDWARSVRDQCQEAWVPFFMKQMSGTKKPLPTIPDDLFIREFPEVNYETRVR